MGGLGGGTVICRLLGVKIGENCFLRMSAGMHPRKKMCFSCMGAQFLNFWCYVECSLWDV